MKEVKKWLFEIVNDNDNKSLPQKCAEIFLIILIVTNVLAVAIESSIDDSRYFYSFEKFSVAVFTIEYLIRIWAADLKYPKRSKIKARARFLTSFMGIVDLCAILPFFLMLFTPFNFDARVLRVFRLIRLFRLLKLMHFLESFKMIVKVLKKRRNELLVTFFVVFMVLVIASTFIYELEKKVQPDKFPDVMSAMWWAVATLTTIGYGDVYPITNAGKIFAAIISILGIGLVAMPTAIISSGFMDEVREFESKKACKEDDKKEESELKFCPNCGLKLNQFDATYEFEQRK